jgi:nucleoid DNA-binding protein
MIKNKEEIIYSLANKYNLPIKTVQKIVNYQFKFVEKIMKKGNFDSIRLPYFGKFKVNKKRVEHITKLKNESKK